MAKKGKISVPNACFQKSWKKKKNPQEKERRHSVGDEWGDQTERERVVSNRGGKTMGKRSRARQTLAKLPVSSITNQLKGRDARQRSDSLCKRGYKRGLRRTDRVYQAEKSLEPEASKIEGRGNAQVL